MKRTISLIIFITFYILSICTCNIPYPEYAKQPTLSFLISFLTILSFLFVTAFYADNKKFLIVISIYFICVFIVSLVALILDGLEFSKLTLPLYLIFLSYAVAIQHFELAVINLLKSFNANVTDVCVFYIDFIILIVMIYSTYYLSKRIQLRNRQDNTLWNKKH